MEPTVLALQSEADALIRQLQTVQAGEWDRITNCPPWTLAELVIHTAGSVILADFDPAAPADVPREPADYYRRPERDTAEYRDRNAHRAQEVAVHVLTQQSASEYFEETLHRTVQKLADTDLGHVVAIRGVGAMRLADWLVSRVIAVAAHGVDVALTLHRSPWTTVEALELMRPVFISLLGTEPPAALEWDDQQFFEVATGRRELTALERVSIGSASGRFPLLA